MIEYIGVGKIPIRNYLVIMDIRCYSPELAIEYTKDIYGIDISEEIKTELVCWDYSKNVYKLFEEEFPNTTIDDGTRDYFQNKGKSRYNKFYRTYKESEGYDLVIDSFDKPDVVHHIFPLVFGGNSNLMNLIPINNLNHKILHENSVEKKRECCFMAVDYLSYLYSATKLMDLNEKYNIMQYKDCDGSFVRNFYHDILKQEMKCFYECLKAEYEPNLKGDNYAS